MFRQIKKSVFEKGRRLGYLGLILLTVIALMNVVHNLTYLEPTDGATWELIDNKLHVQATDVEAARFFQIDDVLIGIDDISLDNLSEYRSYLYDEMPIGSRHLYRLERSGQSFEPWVEIRGLKKGKGDYYVYAFTGFVYLIFLFLLLSQDVSYRSKGSLIIFCFFVFIRFVFHHTDRFSLLDYISYFLDFIGGFLLASALAGVALNQSFPRWRGLMIAQAIQWSLGLILLGATLLWVIWPDWAPKFMAEDVLGWVVRIQGVWGGSMIVLSILALGLVAELRSSEKNFTLFWAIAWTPFALSLWKLDYPFSVLIAGLAPIILPIALLLEWSGRDELHLGLIGKKILVHVSVVFVLMVGYFLFLSLTQFLLGSTVSPGTQPILLGIGVMFAAISYNPIQQYAAEILDRLIYGKRFASIRYLSDFSGIDRADTNIDEFLGIILNRIQKAFMFEAGGAYKAGENAKVFQPLALAKSTHGFVFEELNSELLEGEIIRGGQAKAFFINREKAAPFQPEDYICPIRVTNKLAALLVLSPTSGDFKLTPEEMRLLKSLLHQCDVLMENMELYQSVHQKAESIAQLKEYNENIIESSRIGILTTDEMNKVVSCNSALAELAGRSKSDLLGKTYEQIFTAKQVRKQRRVLSGFTVEGSFFNLEGEELHLEVEKNPLRTKENVVYGTLYLVEDIHEKKRMDKKMMQQEKLASIGLLAAGVAHEINTPLTGITSYAQILIKDAELGEEQKELLQLIQGQSQRAANIVTELLHFSRKESLPKGPVNLMDVLNQTLRFLSHQIQKKKVQITVVEPRKEALIEGYANQLQQVFLNLIVNAMDAMPGGGKLEVGARVRKKGIEMWFKDTGLGMDGKIKHHIFDPFFTTKEVGKGTGLGLSVVYRIIQDHHGAIEVESVQGKGTVFLLQFPLATASPEDTWPGVDTRDFSSKTLSQ